MMLAPQLLAIIAAVPVAYLIGSLSSAIIVCKIMRLPDPRTEGSNNPGATNVLRLGGKKAAFITLLGDMLKGTLPVLLAHSLGFSAIGLSFVLFAAFLGHLFPIFFGFQGGKGVATALGGLLGLAWPAGVCSLITWLLLAILFRYSSLASLITAFLMPIYIDYFTHEPIDVVTVSLISIMLIYRHRRNILNLMKGTESKLGKKKTP